MPSHGRKPINPQRVKPKPRNRRVPPPPARRDGKKSEDCCPMVAAVRSVKRGKFRLARRYAAMSAGLIVARVGRVWA
jgi:hypothetical protein